MLKLNDFNKIWCLHCIEQEERLKTSQYEFKKVGILDKVEYRFTSFQPNNINFSKIFPNIKNTGEFHCTREHYTMIKIAYKLKYDYILIFENDIKLIKKKYFDQFMNNIPDDFDILRLGGQCSTYAPTKDMYDKGILWEYCNYYLWSTIGYGLSRKGMEYYLNYINTFYPVADMPLYDIDRIKENNLNCYVSTLPITYFYEYKSSIQQLNQQNQLEYAKLYYNNLDTSIYE